VESARTVLVAVQDAHVTTTVCTQPGRWNAGAVTVALPEPAECEATGGARRPASGA
jgi:hypothetical protein